MLVLTRRETQRIKIGPQITISVERLGRGTVRLGIVAPKELHILRGELERKEPPQAA